MIKPRCKSTQVKGEEWIVHNFSSLLEELEYLGSFAKNEVVIYRGQRDFNWPIVSTFHRSCIEHWNGLGWESNLKFHNFVVQNLQHKLHRWQASKDLKKLVRLHNLDEGYEVFRKMQQDPKEDTYLIKGTNFLDWSKSKHISLFFATDGQVSDSALFACFLSRTGNVQQTKKFFNVMSLLEESSDLSTIKSLPLFFHPPTVTRFPKANIQEAVYIIQTDFTRGCDEVWRHFAWMNLEQVHIKIRIPIKLKSEIVEYLANLGITRDYVYDQVHSH